MKRTEHLLGNYGEKGEIQHQGIKITAFSMNSKEIGADYLNFNSQMNPPNSNRKMNLQMYYLNSFFMSMIGTCIFG